VCYSHQTNIVEVTIKFTLFFSEFTGHFLACISGETDDRQDSLSQRNMVAPISRYRSRLFIKVFKRPNTLTYTFLRIGISDSWWHGKQVCEYFEIKKEIKPICHTVLLWLRCVTWQYLPHYISVRWAFQLLLHWKQSTDLSWTLSMTWDRVAVSSLQPRFEKLCNAKQAHCSH